MKNSSISDAVGKILVVEDDRIVRRALKRLFEWNGFVVETCADGSMALPAYRRLLPDAVVLDLHLPGMPGIDVCRQVRSESQWVPIVILSAVTDVTDRVVLLELGADDYVTKPFSPKELLARVRAAIRHSLSNTTFPVATPQPASDCVDVSAKVGSGATALTHRESKILEVFLKNAGVVLTRRELLIAVYGSEDSVCPRAIDEHIMHLRRKLEPDPSHPVHLCTVHGSGYKFVP